MAQHMPLPLTISCSGKYRLLLPFWYWLTQVVPDKIQKSHKMIVYVCACACARARAHARACVSVVQYQAELFREHLQNYLYCCECDVKHYVARKQKMRARDDLPSVPRSLFDCPQTIAQRVERDGRLMKTSYLKPVKPQMTTVPGINRPLEPVQDHPEWLIHEDWALLQVCATVVEDTHRIIIMLLYHEIFTKPSASFMQLCL